MGRLRRIFELANAKLPSYNGAFIKARGIAHPIDVFLSGRLRFARKVGSPMPIWLPENQTTLAARANFTSSRLELVDIIPWIVVGSKLRIAPGAFVFVDDILEDGRVVTTTETLTTTFDIGTTVDLFGHPLELNGTFTTFESPSVNPVPDEFVRDLVPKGAAVARADTDQPLVGELTIDGFVTTAGEVVLVTDQADPTENGLWTISPFNWTRPSNFKGGDPASRAQVFVTGGDTYAGSSWICTNIAGNDTIADPFAVPPIIGNALTWTRLSTVTTFIVHSTQPIYPGDVINFKSFEYDIAEALATGVLPDGRTTYQITIDVGIPEDLEDGRSDQVFLRAYPSYESEQLPVPEVPLTSITIGPFLFDRISGSFFEDLEVEEVDVVSTHTASGALIDRQVLRDGKNFLIYNLALPADSFLFWDRSEGRPNFNRDKQTFVAFTDDEGLFHMHFKCVPEIEHRPAGFEGWRVQVTPEEDVFMVIELEPNDVLAPFTARAPGAALPPPPPRGGVFLPGGVTTSVNIDFPEGSDPIEFMHILIQSEAVLKSGSSAPFALAAGLTLDISVDGGTTQTVTFSPGDFVDIFNATALEVATKINSVISGLTASALSDGRVLLRSDNRGSGSSLQVTGGTANLALAFPTTLLGGAFVPNVRVDMGGWEIRGVQTTVFVSHATIARVTGRNVWASGPAFAKPNWLRLAYLMVQTDIYSKFNNGLLAT